MKAATDGHPERFVEYRLIRLAVQLRRRFEIALRPVGLSPRQFSVLAVVQSRPEVTSADLARAVLTTPQSMGVIIEQLEGAGLLQPRERRGKGVPSPTRLSMKGESTLQAALSRVQSLDAETRRHLRKEYAALERILGVLETLETSDAIKTSGQSEH
ncbi:MAG: MarR family winged helix-turn-helix transcriptional regulator [Propionicimonas sp.]